MINKIGIVTLHFAHNAGAMLQAYALSKVMGEYAKCEIINYQPEYHVKRYRLSEMYYHPNKVFLSMISKDKLSIKDYGKATINYFWAKKNPVYANAKNRNKVFAAFLKKLPLSKKCYTKKDVENLRGFSSFVVGSDQVWNKNILGGEYDPVYFLDLNSCSQKYSYAVSAEDDLPFDDIKKIKYMTQSFLEVSVREKLLFEQLSANGIECHMDIDPTLLLEKDDYFAIEKTVQISKPFIFVYCFEATRELCEVVEYLMKKMQCSAVVWGKDEEIKLDGISDAIYVTSMGPEEFLYCIHNASYVVTASFHGTAFSVIYRKQFVVLNPIVASNRITTLLEGLHLEKHRYINNDCLIFDESFSECEERLQEKQTASINYIKRICHQSH